MNFLNKLLAVLIVLSVFQTGYANQTHLTPQEQKMQNLFGKSVRTRDLSNCSAILSLASSSGRVDNSSGYKISNTKDLLELQKSLEKILSEVIPADQIKADLSLTGLPMWDKSNKEFIQEVKTSLQRANVPTDNIKIIPMYTPQAKGVTGVLQRMRALLPMKQDYERPIKEEIYVGMPAVVGSEVTTLMYALAAFPPEISIPMATAHFTLLGGLTAFRRANSNWLNRSTNSAEVLAKTGMTSLLFIINYNVVSQWTSIWNGLQEKGLANYAVENVPTGLANFAQTQGLTTVVQTLFIWVTFGKGMNTWEAMMTQKGTEASDFARRGAAVITPSIFWVSGPALTWASTTTEMMSYLPMNPGQASLLALTLGGTLMAMRPERFTPVAGFVDKVVYQPFGKIKAKLKKNESNELDVNH